MKLTTWMSFGKKALCCVTSAALAACMAAPAAFAQDGYVAAEPGALAAQASNAWKEPGAPVSASKVASDKVVTVGSHSYATTLPEMLGFNNTTWATTSYDPTSLAQARTNDRLGVFGSEANVSPNPYLANLFFGFTGSSSKADASVTAVKHTMSYTAPDMFNATDEPAYGIPSDMALRPDVVVGIGGSPGNMSMKLHGTTTARNYASWGARIEGVSQPYQTVLRTRSRTDDPSVVGTLNNDGNAYVLSEYFRAGDNDYDPIASAFANGSIRDLSGDFDGLAWAGKLAMQQQSKSSRYDDPIAIARKYEQYAQATKWYVLSKLASGTQKKTVAVVSSVTNDNKFNIVKLSADGDSTGHGLVRVAEAVCDTVDDLAAREFPDAALGSRSNTVDASTLMKADVVIGLPASSENYKASADDVSAALKAGGYSESSPGWPAIVGNEVTFGTFDNLVGFNSSPESALLVGYIQAMVYPELLNPVDMVTYFSSQFYHLKEDSLPSFVKGELADATLPDGVTLEGSAYSAATVAGVQSILDEGTSYYYANKASIDAAHPKIASTDSLDDANGYGVQSTSITAPSGATLTVYDEHGLIVPPTSNNTYLLDSDDAGSFTIAKQGYRDYTRSVRGGDSPIAVTDSDLTKAKSVTISVPNGALLTVRDADNATVKPDANGAYALDADKDATFTVNLANYMLYQGTIRAADTSIAVALSDMTRKTFATTFVIPSGSRLAVTDSSGKAVAQTAVNDGLRCVLESGLDYKVTVSMTGYAPYTTTIVGGDRTTVTIRKNMLGRTELTLNKATVSASDISAVDAAAVTSIRLGTAVKSIGKGAFSKCAKLEKVTGGSNVTTIGESAFAGCTKLTSVAVGTRVKTIGKAAFSKCASLKSISLASAVSSVKASAFSGCKKLSTLTVKTKKLTKAGVKKSLAGSSVKTVKVAVGNAKANKTYVKKYKGFFTKANCGKAVTVK